LKVRRDTMTAALRTTLPELTVGHVPLGGYLLWPRLPDGTDEAALVAGALRAGVAVAPGRPYFSAEPPAPHIRLSFAAVAGPAEITEGIRRLRTACDEVLE
ncbi:PLP-dependent aminotransferase family protein, partial [Streptomyces sp. NPDC056728]